VVKSRKVPVGSVVVVVGPGAVVDVVVVVPTEPHSVGYAV
jgi:hypothetical protein